YPTVGNNVGMAASPVLYKGLLIHCLENAGESFAVAIDKHTGENRWRIERPRGINWVTPLVITVDKGHQVLFQGPSDLSAHDPGSCKNLWSITDKPFSTMPSPTFADGTIFTAGGKFFAIRPPSDGAAKPQILWESDKLPTGYASPVYSEGKVYTLSSQGLLN